MPPVRPVVVVFPKGLVMPVAANPLDPKLKACPNWVLVAPVLAAFPLVAELVVDVLPVVEVRV